MCDDRFQSDWLLSVHVRSLSIATAPNDDTTQEAEAIDGVGGKGVVLQEIVQSQDEIDAKKSRDEMDEMPKDEIDAEITEEEIGAQKSEDETDLSDSRTRRGRDRVLRRVIDGRCGASSENGRKLPSR